MKTTGCSKSLPIYTKQHQYQIPKDAEVFISCLIFFNWKVIKNFNLGYVNVSLGAFEKLRQTTINFVMSVRPSVRMEQFGSNMTDFCQILCLINFRKSVEEIQF
jgi:hypothetical protein